MNTPETAAVPANNTPPPRRWPRRILRFLMIYVCVPCVSVLLILVLAQRRLIYHPSATAPLSVKDAGLGDGLAEDVQLETADGETLHGWMIHPHPPTGDPANRPLVIYFPGNAGHRLERLADLREVASAGFDVLVFDYRGYADSTGSPSQASLERDARQVWDYACTLRAPGRIVIFGESLGGAVALSLWSDEHRALPTPAAVILNSTFTGMADVVRWHYPWLPLHFFLLDPWPSAERIPRVECPVTIFHGTDDDLVPVSHGRTLARLARQSHFVEIPHGTHNNIPMGQLRAALLAIRAEILGLQ
ncbi:MAG: alpha/beta hydrolase [Planctomycetales bacterium]